MTSPGEKSLRVLLITILCWVKRALKLYISLCLLLDTKRKQNSSRQPVHKNMPLLFHLLGFPGYLDSKESAWNVGDLGLIPGLGRSPGGGHGNPLQYSCWKISWAEEPGGIQCMGSQRVIHDWVTKHIALFIHPFTHPSRQPFSEPYIQSASHLNEIHLLNNYNTSSIIGNSVENMRKKKQTKMCCQKKSPSTPTLSLWR